MSKNWNLWGVVILLALCFGAKPVCAYDEAAVTDMKTKMLAPRSAQGMYLGAFLLKPSLSLQQQYEDNIYRTATDKEDDWISIVAPDVKLQSNWNLHQIELGATTKIARYKENESENYEDYAYYISGRADVDYGTYFSGQLKQERRHEDRGSLDDVDGDEPIEIDIRTGTLRFTRDLSKLKLYLDGTLRDFSYSDSRRGGTIIDNSDRNRKQTILQAKLAYALTDQFDIFTQLSHDRRKYDEDGTEFRDSEGYEYRLGAAMNITGKLEGNIYAGYLKQRYESTFEDVKAPSFGGALLWNITGLTSLNAGVERRVQETTLAGSSGILNTSYNLNLQHALTDDVLLEAKFETDQDEYEGGGSSRDNTTHSPGVAVQYFMNHGLSARLSYDYLKREYSDNDDNGYENNRAMFSISYAY